MSGQKTTRLLKGAVQLNDACLGPERSGCKVGQGAVTKAAFVAAVPVNEGSQPVHSNLNMISGFNSKAIAKWAKANLKPMAVVSSDGLWRFAAVTDAGYIHVPSGVGALKSRDMPAFNWVNTLLGNLKTMMPGACKALKFRKHAQPYLYAFRTDSITGSAYEASSSICPEPSLCRKRAAWVGMLRQFPNQEQH